MDLSIGSTSELDEERLFTKDPFQVERLSDLEKKVFALIIQPDLPAIAQERILALLALLGTKDIRKITQDIRQIRLGTEFANARLLKKIARFWKEHKKEIIIGAIIVATVITVGVATGAPLTIDMGAGGVCVAMEVMTLGSEEKTHTSYDLPSPCPNGYHSPQQVMHQRKSAEAASLEISEEKDSAEEIAKEKLLHAQESSREYFTPFEVPPFELFDEGFLPEAAYSLPPNVDFSYLENPNKTLTFDYQEPSLKNRDLGMLQSIFTLYEISQDPSTFAYSSETGLEPDFYKISEWIVNHPERMQGLQPFYPGSPYGADSILNFTPEWVKKCQETIDQEQYPEVYALLEKVSDWAENRPPNIPGWKPFVPYMPSAGFDPMIDLAREWTEKFQGQADPKTFSSVYNMLLESAISSNEFHKDWEKFTQKHQKPHIFYTAVNGISVNQELLEEYKVYFKDRITHGKKVDWTYNEDRGFRQHIHDLLYKDFQEQLAPAGEELKAKILDFYEKNKENPEARIIHFCHSQGGLITGALLRQLPKEVRSLVYVISIASPIPIYNEDCGGAVNLVSDRDSMPLGKYVYKRLPFNIEEMHKLYRLHHEGKTANMLYVRHHPEACSFFDHHLRSPTYEILLAELIKNGFFHESH
ncbi:MAG: hypothetical protein AAGI90_02040 [Chlamydiota bacterium]